MRRRSIVAILLLLVVPALPVAAKTVDAAEVVRSFLARYAAGDVAGLAALMTDPKSVAAYERRMQKRCRVLERLDLTAVSPTVYETTEVYTTWSSLPGAAPRIEEAHSRITLAGGKISKWESREAELADRLIAAKDAAERAALFAASPELQTTALVDAFATRVGQLVNQSKYDIGENFAAWSLQIADQVADPYSRASALSTLATCARIRRPRALDLALTYSDEAMAFAEKLRDADISARVRVRHARVLEDRKEFPGSELLQHATNQAEAIEDTSIVAQAATHIARYLDQRGQHRQAFIYSEMASRYAGISGDPTAIVGATMNLGAAYAYTGDVDLSLRYWARAADEAAAAGYMNMVAACLGVSASVMSEREPREALAHINDSIARMEKVPAARRALVDMLRRRFLINVELQQFDAAERDLDRSIEIDGNNDPVYLADNRLFRSHLALGRGQYEEAFRIAETAMQSTYRNDGPRYVQALALRCMGRNDESLARFEELVATANAAQSAMSDPDRKVFFGDRRSDLHRHLLDILVEQGQSGRALEVAEQMKARTLRRAVSHGAGATASLTGHDLTHDRVLNKRVSDLQNAVGKMQGDALEAAKVQLADARADLADFRQRLFVRRPELRAQQSDNNLLVEVPGVLDDVTVIEYIVLDHATYVFILEPRRNGERHINVQIVPVPARELRLAVERFTSAVESRSLRFADAGDALYRLILEPLAPSLANARSLCVIPHDDLWRVPFHALGPKGGKLLVDRVPVFYAPSIAVLAASASRPKSTEKPALLALANPMVSARTATLYRSIYRDGQLGAIPETETEVRNIARIYGKDRSRILIGDEARETIIKNEASGYDILHIATHGVIDESAPMFSSLVLAASGGGAEDGLLEAREIVNIQLGADLAVLSACETGRVNSTYGSGVIGLSWALLAAGCRTTVVSQWKAQSAATADLMVEFHRQLVNGASKPEALHRAQLRLRKDPRYAHPFYWAPFVVLGAP
ncbi:MAG TPA: CHAT domain-containing protein [Thermoanaerobaculia bacterium]|jgi:CHAT domain-containing protein